MASGGKTSSEKFNYDLCSQGLGGGMGWERCPRVRGGEGGGGGGGGGGGAGVFASRLVPQLLADWLKKANEAAVSLSKVLFCLSPPWAPGVWTFCGSHLLLCSNKAGVLQPPPLTPLSRCPGCPECVNPATPICSATCLLVLKYLPAVPLLLEALKTLPPTLL